MEIFQEKKNFFKIYWVPVHAIWAYMVFIQRHTGCNLYFKTTRSHIILVLCKLYYFIFVIAPEKRFRSNVYSSFSVRIYFNPIPARC
jgi:hypothetical protein